jgi:hypothetical protein
MAKARFLARSQHFQGFSCARQRCGFSRSPPVIQVRLKPLSLSDPAFARSFALRPCDGEKLAADEISHVITPYSKEQDISHLTTNEGL